MVAGLPNVQNRIPIIHFRRMFTIIQFQRKVIVINKYDARYRPLL